MHNHCPGHSVIFYDVEAKADEASALFLYEGMRQGEDAVIIATSKRRAALLPWLVRFGLDGLQKDSPRLFMYDAEIMISSFMVGGMPDEELFRSALMLVFKKTRPKLRAFGEMVDILARRGEFAAALRLEELWNQEIAERSFPLFCAYSSKSFATSGQTIFDEICRQHSDVFHAIEPAHVVEEISAS